MVVGNQEWSPSKKEKTIEDVLSELNEHKKILKIIIILIASILIFLVLHF